MSSYIVAAEREVDGVGDLSPVYSRWNKLRDSGARLAELVIDPLEAGWDSPCEPDHFRSGCAPVEALARADELVRGNHADVVLIRGQDNLRSRYAHDRAAVLREMAIYGDECSIPQAYTMLAKAFIRRHNLSPTKFRQLAEALFENYLRTAQRDSHFEPPKPQAFEMVTELFRKVDCANPVVDFSGAVVVASSAFADARSVKILAAEVAQSAGDGPEHVEEIARYDHLRRACDAAGARAGINLAHAFRESGALLEAYTCFPVVPLGFLLASGTVSHIEEVEPLLTTHEITVTGGMSLARAPWNLPALNGLVVMCERLITDGANLGVVHGNGGLGYKQGIAILRK